MCVCVCVTHDAPVSVCLGVKMCQVLVTFASVSVVHVRYVCKKARKSIHSNYRRLYTITTQLAIHMHNHTHTATAHSVAHYMNGMVLTVNGLPT